MQSLSLFAHNMCAYLACTKQQREGSLSLSLVGPMIELLKGSNRYKADQ